MRSLVVTAFVTFTVTCSALAAGWAVEASALPRPANADRAAVDGLVVLEQHRVVESSLRVGDGPMLRGDCARGWFPAHGTLLTLSDGAHVFDGAGHEQISPTANAELELAGCPHVLSNILARLLQSGVNARAANVWMGRPEIALRIASLTLYVTPKHYVPVGVAIHTGSFSGRSRLAFAS
jgi:hypothetical protein